MDNIELMDCEVIFSYQCPSCSRAFVACGHAVADTVCTCGAELVERPLPRGVYEVMPAIPLRPRAAKPRGPDPRAKEIEHDLGYGASHGHAPGHEGPTGPGDAPAEVSPVASPR